ncbi:MAG TPA: competence protein, partial [Lachnoclostridium phytofermentans]|nr:competence protein [Lachnoclostridium phytofermentans]
MKLEKISDTQIRCTLNKEDLMDRELRISELAYGSDKAKQLFREMMQQAAYEFGFEAEDIPLMIEATPVSADCLVLVITKVEDPDELDTRFSNFTPYASDDDDLEEEEEEE